MSESRSAAGRRASWGRDRARKRPRGAGARPQREGAAQQARGARGLGIRTSPKTPSSNPTSFGGPTDNPYPPTLNDPRGNPLAARHPHDNTLGPREWGQSRGPARHAARGCCTDSCPRGRAPPTPPIGRPALVPAPRPPPRPGFRRQGRGVRWLPRWRRRLRGRCRPLRACRARSSLQPSHPPQPPPQLHGSRDGRGQPLRTRDARPEGRSGAGERRTPGLPWGRRRWGEGCWPGGLEPGAWALDGAPRRRTPATEPPSAPAWAAGAAGLPPTCILPGGGGRGGGLGGGASPPGSRDVGQDGRGGSPFLRRPGPSARPPSPPPRRRPVGARRASAPSRRRGPSSPVPPTHPGRVRARPRPHPAVRSVSPVPPSGLRCPPPRRASQLDVLERRSTDRHGAPGSPCTPGSHPVQGDGAASPCPWRVPVSRLSWHSRWVRGVGVRLLGAAFPPRAAAPSERRWLRRG